jgi:hypothetical protein
VATTVALDIAPGLVPTTETNVIGPVPANHEFDIPVFRFVNNSSQDSVQLTIWNKTSIAAGTDADVETRISIQPQSTYEHGPMVLAAGRVISVMALTAGLISERPHGWDIGP